MERKISRLSGASGLGIDLFDQKLIHLARQPDNSTRFLGKLAGLDSELFLLASE